MNLFKKALAKIKMATTERGFHPSYYKVGDDGLSTAEHIVLNDEYIRCMVKFKQPMDCLEGDRRTLWISTDKKSIICVFTYDRWYSLFLKIGLGIDIAERCITISSNEQESRLKTEANA